MLRGNTSLYKNNFNLAYLALILMTYCAIYIWRRTIINHNILVYLIKIIHYSTELGQLIKTYPI